MYDIYKENVSEQHSIGWKKKRKRRKKKIRSSNSCTIYLENSIRKGWKINDLEEEEGKRRGILKSRGRCIQMKFNKEKKTQENNNKIIVECHQKSIE